jgi:hypothetical protein
MANEQLAANFEVPLDELRTKIPDVPERFDFGREGTPISLEVDGVVYPVIAESEIITADVFFDPNNRDTQKYQEHIRARIATAVNRNTAYSNEKHLYQQAVLDGANESDEVSIPGMFLEAQQERTGRIGAEYGSLAYARLLNRTARVFDRIPGLQGRRERIDFRAMRGLNELSYREDLDGIADTVEKFIELLRTNRTPIELRRLRVERDEEPSINITRVIMGDYPRQGHPSSWNGVELGAVLAVFRGEKRLHFKYDGRDIIAYSIGNLDNYDEQTGHITPHHREVEVVDLVPEVGEPVPNQDNSPKKLQRLLHPEGPDRITLRELGWGGYGLHDHIVILTGKGMEEITIPVGDKFDAHAILYDLPEVIERRSTMHEMAHWLDRNLMKATIPQREGFARAFEFDYNFEVLKRITREQRKFTNPVTVKMLELLFAATPPDGKRWGNAFSKSETYYVTGAFYCFMHNHFEYMGGNELAAEKVREFYVLVCGSDPNKSEYKGNLWACMNHVFGFEDETSSKKFVEEEFMPHMNM